MARPNEFDIDFIDVCDSAVLLLHRLFFSCSEETLKFCYLCERRLILSTFACSQDRIGCRAGLGLEASYQKVQGKKSQG
jgi:hypothetical protein